MFNSFLFTNLVMLIRYILELALLTAKIFWDIGFVNKRFSWNLVLLIKDMLE